MRITLSVKFFDGDLEDPTDDRTCAYVDKCPICNEEFVALQDIVGYIPFGIDAFVDELEEEGDVAVHLHCCQSTLRIDRITDIKKNIITTEATFQGLLVCRVVDSGEISKEKHLAFEAVDEDE